jgi:diadenosine tetraphosphate (Ap4A) HIT family hydrolase
MVVGEEVPHAHVHLIPFVGLDQLDFRNADQNPDPAQLDDVAARIRAGRRAAGASGVADA